MVRRPAPVFPVGPEQADEARAVRFRSRAGTYVVLSVPSPATPRAALSPAEQQIKQALLRGESQREIAEARGTSTRTVANQVARLFRKLGVSSRAELAALDLLDRRGP